MGGAPGRVQVVSLGASCSVKASLVRLGIGEAHLPLDWMRTSMQGLIYWLRNGFKQFFKVNQMLHVTMEDTGEEMRVFRSHWHSFWYDDIDEDRVRERFSRRIDRFLALADDTDTRELLFVRSIANTSELDDVETLFELLQERFERYGRRVFLCIVVPDQPITGPVRHATEDRMLFWVQPQKEDSDESGPFEDAVAYAMHWVLSLTDPDAEVDDGSPVVSIASELLSKHGPLRTVETRQSIAGVWAGRARVRGYEGVVDVAAFEGYDELAVPLHSSFELWTNQALLPPTCSPDWPTGGNRVEPLSPLPRHSPHPTKAINQKRQQERFELENGLSIRHMRELLTIDENEEIYMTEPAGVADLPPTPSARQRSLTSDCSGEDLLSKVSSHVNNLYSEVLPVARERSALSPTPLVRDKSPLRTGTPKRSKSADHFRSYVSPKSPPRGRMSHGYDIPRLTPFAEACRASDVRLGSASGPFGAKREDQVMSAIIA